MLIARRKPLEFKERECVFLKVTPTARIDRAMRVKKLTPRFIGSYQILKRIGSVAYQIALPVNLSNLHNVFHGSQLRKYHSDPSHLLEPQSVKLKDNLTFNLPSVKIVDWGVK